MACPHGYYCPGKPGGTWPAGFSDTVQMLKCDAGHYCPTRSTSPTHVACPKGTFQPNTGAKSLDECMPAPPGFYIPAAGTATVDPTKICTQGYFCRMASYKAIPDPSTDSDKPTPLIYADYGGKCAAGWYCPAGTPKPIACTPGKRCTTAALAAPDADCPAGKFCPRGTSGAGETCPTGHYCPLNSGEPIMCPAGTFRATGGAALLTDCTACTAGYYCPFNAMTAVDTTNHKCEPGFICAAGSIHPRAVLCPKGYKCPNDNLPTVWDKVACADDS